jgi:hypothetical protein
MISADTKSMGSSPGGPSKRLILTVGRRVWKNSLNFSGSPAQGMGTLTALLRALYRA